jgi:hypothetical protein
MKANYVLIRYDADGREIERNDESGIKRFEFYSLTFAMRSMEIATSISKGTQCAKLYRRRRAGGYRWVATRFRGGAHLTAWGE